MTGMTKAQRDAALFIRSRNEFGMGAIMPYAEMIVAANELTALGLAEDRGRTERRWLTDSGRRALQTEKDA